MNSARPNLMLRACLTIFACLTLTTPSLAQAYTCDRGPILRTYGGSEWAIYGCDDDISLIILRAKNRTASSSYFMYTGRNGRYELSGSTSPKAVYDALAALTPEEWAALAAAAKAAD